MKILLIAHFFPPKRTAGAEKRALGYAMMLQKLGHTVQVLCAGEWDVGEHHWNGYTDEIYQSISVRRVNLNWIMANDPNRSLYDNRLVEENLSDWLVEWQPDVVHIISLLTLGAGVVRAAKRLGIPVIFTLTDFWIICPKISLVHGDGSLCDGQTSDWNCIKCLLGNTKVLHGLTKIIPESFSESMLIKVSRKTWLNRQRGLRGKALDIYDRRKVMTEITSQVDSVIAPSTYLARVIEKNGVFSLPIQVIHSGHDLSWLNHMPEPQTSEVIRFGYIGQLIPVKGVDILIQAYRTSANNKKGRLLIYGSAKHNPEYAASLQAMAQPDDGIKFMGEFPHDRLGDVLAGLDVLVVPSQWHENNPRVIQEAFAAKVPVIASNVGGIAEFIEHDVNGLLFDHNSIDDLQVQIERIITEPGLLRRLKSEIKPVKTIAEEIDEIVGIYESLVSVSDVVL